MGVFADRETRSVINGLSQEAGQKSVEDLFDMINKTCADPIPLSNLLDKIVSGGCIADNIDNILQGKNGTPDINTYPYGKKSTDVFHYMHAVFRYGMRMESLIKSLSGYVDSPNTVGGDKKTILITTDFCNPEFIDTLEDTLADMYFTGNLAAIIVFFTEYGCSNVPFYMNYRWNIPNSSITNISDIISKLGSPITFEEYDYDFNGPGESNKYSIEINSVKDTKIINKITNKTKIVKGRTARRFIEALWDFSEQAPPKIGGCTMDNKTYHIAFAGRDYNGLYVCDDLSEKLVQIFKDLIGNL